jgi:aspartyl protease family protein
MVTVNRPTVIQMSKRNGVYYVPVTMNGLTLDFIFDTGAADILISFAEFATLLRQGKISESDMLGTEIYMDASGNVSESQQFIIRELRLGDRVIYNVKASISESLDAPLLLGQSALERFGTVEIDYEKNQVILSN